MSDLSNVQLLAKKVSSSLTSNKGMSAGDKKKIQEFLDQIVDRLDDLQPRKDQLEEMISGRKTLNDEIKKFNTDQNPLKDNGDGLKTVLDRMSPNPTTKSIINDLYRIADTVKSAKDLKP